MNESAILGLTGPRPTSIHQVQGVPGGSAHVEGHRTVSPSPNRAPVLSILRCAFL